MLYIVCVRNRKNKNKCVNLWITAWYMDACAILCFFCNALYLFVKRMRQCRSPRCIFTFSALGTEDTLPWTLLPVEY